MSSLSEQHAQSSSNVVWGVADDGSVVEISVHPSARDVLMDRWPPLGLAPSSHPTGPVACHMTARPSGPGDASPLPSAELRSWGGWNRIESDLALFTAERLSGLVAIHAGVIVVNGRALIVPGKSRAGKSTLCVAAHDAGADVLTDEYALVEPGTGLVTGWRRLVRMRRADGGIDRLDIAIESEPVPVALVALVTYSHRDRRAWQPVGAADAALGLLANTVCARSRPDESLDAALAIARSARAVSGTRGEAATAVADLLDLLHRPNE